MEEDDDSGDEEGKEVAAAAVEDQEEGWETIPSRNKRRRKETAAAAKATAATIASSRRSATPAALLPFSPECLVSICGKLQFLYQLFRALQARKSRVLVFSQMTRALDVLEDYLAVRRIRKSMVGLTARRRAKRDRNKSTCSTQTNPISFSYSRPELERTRSQPCECGYSCVV